MKLTSLMLQISCGRKLLSILVGTLLLSSCATTQDNPALQLKPAADYFKLVKQHTQHKQIYNGFHAILNVHGTLLTSSVLRHQVDHYARLFQWSPETYQNELAKTESSLAQNTEIFLSFYVPEKRHDDLARPKTVWHIFLDSGGKRYEGKATRIKSVTAELRAMYPHHNRWSTAYKISFPVPTSVIENADAKLFITGPIASTQLDYKAD